MSWFTFGLLYPLSLHLGSLFSSFQGHTLFFDWFLRGDVSNPQLLSYSFLWTLFFYVPTWFTLLFWLSFIFTTSVLPVGILWVLIPAFFYLIDSGATSCSLWQYETLATLTPHLNILLLNNLNRYHPFLLYCAAITLVVGCGLSYAVSFLGHSVGNGFEIHLLNSFTQSSGFFYGLVALGGGSWWALQEGTWGGWWNWDASEVLGLLPLLPILLTYHGGYAPSYLINNFNRNDLLTLISVGSYFAIQLNFENASHNFGIHLFFFFTNDFFFSTILLILFAALVTLLLSEYFILPWSIANYLLRNNSTSTSSWIISASQSVVVVAFLLPTIMVLFSTTSLALTPSARWVFMVPVQFFLNLNLWFFLLLLPLFGLKHPPTYIIWALTQGLQFWQWVFVWINEGRSFSLSLRLHLTIALFFYLNVILIDTLVLGHVWGTRLGFDGGGRTFYLRQQCWGVHHDLLSTTLVGGSGNSLTALTTSFQTTSWSPTNYFLVMTNLWQANCYLLTDKTRLLLAEVGTTYLLTNAILILSILKWGWFFYNRP